MDNKQLFLGKTAFLVFCILIFLSCFSVAPLTGEDKTEVLMKFSDQGTKMRIVLETDLIFANAAKITTSPPEIRIEFPGSFHITYHKKPPFAMTLQDRVLILILNEKADIRFFKLLSPARLVFDIQRSGFPDSTPFHIISNEFVLDAGHGGYDFGITFGDVYEKDIVLSLSKAISKALLKMNKKVYLIRKVDQFVALSDRVSFVNQKSPDIFISLHISLSQNITVYSPKFDELDIKDLTDIYALRSRQKKFLWKSKALSQSLGKSFENEFGQNVLYRELPVPLLNSAGAPCVLIEFPSPKYLLYDQQINERMVNAVLRGFALYGQ